MMIQARDLSGSKEKSQVLYRYPAATLPHWGMFRFGWLLAMPRLREEQPGLTGSCILKVKVRLLYRLSSNDGAR